LNARKRKLAIYGLIRVQLSLQQTIKPGMVRDSFNLTGIYPLDMLKILRSYSCNCSSLLTKNEEDHILTAVSILLEKFKVQGELFDHNFDDVNIKETTNKDKLVTNRRHRIILTSKGCVNRQLQKNQSCWTRRTVKAKQAYSRKRKIELPVDIEQLVLKIPCRMSSISFNTSFRNFNIIICITFESTSFVAISRCLSYFIL